MKRFAPLFILLAASISAAPLAAATKEPLRFNTIVVGRFTNANGMAQSPDFIQYFSDDVSERLENDKIAAQVVEEGTAVPDASSANSAVIEGKFLSHEDAGLVKPGKLVVEISIYRLSDHALVRTWTATTHFPPRGDQKARAYAYYTGFAAGDTIWEALKSIDLSSNSPAAPGSIPAATGTAPVPPSNAAPATPDAAAAPAPPSNAAPATPDAGAAPAPSSSSAPAAPDAAASVQLSSDPAGAEITIDGSYVGNTPSLIKLAPGKHSITMTMPGYAPWVRSIETAAGESRNFAATLEKTTQ
jgi:hypothetical protein